MNTQQIRDEIARAQGWKLPGDEGLLIDGTSVTLTAYHRQVFIETLNNYRYDKQLDHPIPDTLDAAVGVIEGAGWTVDDITFTSHGARGYGCVACAVRDDEPYHTSVTVYYGDSLPKQREVFREAIWQLALACVKASNQHTKGLT